jgi:hypothetical protein
VADLDPATVRAEAERRVRKALDHVQNAQAELDRACAELSNLERGVVVWRLIGKLYDRVHAAWYRVEEFRKQGRFTLDGIALEALAKRLEAQKPGAPDA